MEVRAPTAPAGTTRTAFAVAVRSKVRSAMPDLLGTQELAALLGIKPRTVSAYLVRGGRSVPAPCARLACGPVWKLEDVQDWQKKRLDTRAASMDGS